MIFYTFSEVQKAVHTVRGLYQRWCELLDDPHHMNKDEYNWTTNELRNSIRSIEWDVEDLEETISILLYHVSLCIPTSNGLQSMRTKNLGGVKSFMYCLLVCIEVYYIC